MQKVLGCKARLSRVVSSAVRAGLTAVGFVPCSPAFPHIVVDHITPSCLFIKIPPDVYSTQCCDKFLCTVCWLNILVILLHAAMCCGIQGPGCSLITETTLTKTEEPWKVHSPHVGFFTGIQRFTACSIWVLEQDASWERQRTNCFPLRNLTLGSFLSFHVYFFAILASSPPKYFSTIFKNMHNTFAFMTFCAWMGWKGRVQNTPIT